MTEQQRKEYDSEWHLSKNVPVAIILAIFIQSIGAVWWASSIDNKVNVFNADLRDNEAENLRQWDRINGNELEIAKALSINRINTAILSRVERQVEENNKLLKEFVNGPHP